MSHPYIDNPSNPDVDVILMDRMEEKNKSKRPPMFAVIFHNDDYTPMDFVVELLKKHFGLSLTVAIDKMLEIHESGRTVVGVFTKDIAETKATACNIESSNNEHPLLVTFEPTF